MNLLELTLPTPEENLALDEALLDAAEASSSSAASEIEKTSRVRQVRADAPSIDQATPISASSATVSIGASSAAAASTHPTDPPGPINGEVLRLWESPTPLVVLGNSSRMEDEVHVELCRQRGIPILRRASGGATIVAGPGCLMYAVVLSYQKRPELRSIDATHRFVMETIAAALRQFVPGIARAGISDLVIGDKKFSGNSLRCKRNHVLYHGTLLYNFPIEQIGELLKMPKRQPDYRHQRGHGDFVINLPLSADQLRQTVATAFNATKIAAAWPRDHTSQLVADKYGRSERNERL